MVRLEKCLLRGLAGLWFVWALGSANAQTTESPAAGGNAEWSAAYAQGRSSLEQKAYTPALKAFYEAARIAQMSGDRDGPGVTLALKAVAEVFRLQGRFDLAESTLRQVIAAEKRRQPTGDAELCISLNNLALVLQERRHDQQAEGAYREAIAVHERSCSADDPSLANTLSNYGIFLRERGRFNEAAEVLERSLALHEKLYGRNHIELALPLSNLASVRLDQKRAADAEILLRRALTLRESALGATDPKVALTLANLGAALIDLNRLPEAESVFARALEIRSQHFGDKAETTRRVAESLAQVIQAQGRSQDASHLRKKHGLR